MQSGGNDSLSPRQPQGAKARVALGDMLRATDAQDALEAAEKLIPRLDALSPSELAMVMHRCEKLNVRHEGVILGAAWRIVQHEAPPGDAAAQETSAAALGTALRVLAEKELTNDSLLISSAMGRAVELAPHMYAEALGETGEAVATLNRLYLSFAEAEAQKASRSTEGHVVAADGTLDEPYAPMGGAAIDTEADERHAAEPAMDDALEPAQQSEEAAALSAELAAQEFVHGNTVDALADALEARLLALCERAAAINRQIDGLEAPEVVDEHSGSDGAGSPRSGDLKESLGVLLAKETNATGALPRAVVLTPTAVLSTARMLAAVGLRDPAVVEALAEQMRAMLSQHVTLWLMHRAANRRGGQASQVGDGLESLPVATPELTASALRPRQDESGEWHVGPFQVAQLLEILIATTGIIPRITDVLEPEARGHTAVDARGRAALPLLRVLGPLLGRLPFEYIGRHQPHFLLDVRRLFERMPVLAEACPPLWDRVRLAAVKRSRLDRSKLNPDGRRHNVGRGWKVGDGVVDGARRLGELGAAKYTLSKEVRRRNVDVVGDMPRFKKNPTNPSLAIAKRRELQRKLIQKRNNVAPRLHMAVGRSPQRAFAAARQRAAEIARQKRRQ